jgi:TRAP-type mannitol/chloroaromatic compound transport system substrate-binding protein
MKVPLEKYESYINDQGNFDFAFVNAAMWEESHMLATLFSWVPFGHSLSQHQAWLAQGGQELMDQYFAQYGLKALTFGATGGISGLWTKNGVTDLASLKGGSIYARPLVQKMFLGFGLKFAAVDRTLASLRVGDEGFRMAAGLEGAKMALHRGELAVLDWMSPYRDLQYGIPTQDVGYVNFESNPTLKPSVFFLGVTTLKKWEEMGEQRTASVEALAREVAAKSADRWQRYDEGAVCSLNASGIPLRDFDRMDVLRLKQRSRDILESYAGNNLERNIFSSYVKVG